MSKLVICDDDSNIAQMVEKRVREIFRNHGIGIDTILCNNPKDVLMYCNRESCDCILLDIDMPEMNGFELSQKLQKLPMERIPIIVFMSSHENFVYEVFQYRPFDFIRKSQLKQELEKKLERLIREYIYHSERVELARSELGYLLLRDVLYFKSNRNSVDAYSSEDSYRCRGSIGVLEEKYENCLIRTENRYLVNVNHIRKIGAEYVVLDSNEKIPLSRRRKKYVEERYLSLVRR